MEKPTDQVSYRFGDDRVQQMPYFLYEVSAYKITKDMACSLCSKYYKSDKLLKYKTPKSNKDIVIFIDLIGVPIEFIKENNLSIYKQLKKKKK